MTTATTTTKTTTTTSIPFGLVNLREKKKRERDMPIKGYRRPLYNKPEYILDFLLINGGLN
jgi:hypothetical protein